MKIEKLPQLPWFEPPAPQGLGHGGGPGYSEDGLSNAELGEIVEIALIEQMGFVSALGPHVRKGAFDLIYGDYRGAATSTGARALARSASAAGRGRSRDGFTCDHVPTRSVFTRYLVCVHP
jgi:hypothetical protein